MENRNILAKTLAVIGTVLVWFPILAPVLLGLVVLVMEGTFLFDYLMPAELFLSALIGGGLLIWAAIRARAGLKLIAGGLGVAVVALIGGQGLAVVTGLASGANEATGWRMALVLGSLVIYVLAVIVTGVGGIMLLRDLFKTPQPPIRDGQG
jgi:hypothetical protein